MGNIKQERSAASFASQLVAIRRELHQHPELSNEEFETTGRVERWLREAGLRIRDYSLRTGVVAEVGGRKGGPVVALRADIDALPIQEETGLPFASAVPGKMHACGHDFHAAALIGAALLLKEREDTLGGTVRLLFQPAEEKATGAKDLVAAGVLDGVNAIVGLHNKPDLQVGTIGIRAGPLLAAPDAFFIELKGTGTHGAVPEAGADPILAAAALITSLQSIVSRNVSPLESAVVSVTSVHGGTTWNVIPEKVHLEGTVRSFHPHVRRSVIRRFQEIVDGIAAAFQIQATVRWNEGTPPVHNDEQLAALAWAEAEQLGLLPVTPSLSLGGEDFAVYQQRVPGLFVFIGTAGQYGWHHPKFELDERALPIAVDFLAGIARRLLAHYAGAINESGVNAGQIDE
jgi:amidohydrolase